MTFISNVVYGHIFLSEEQYMLQSNQRMEKSRDILVMFRSSVLSVKRLIKISKVPQ